MRTIARLAILALVAGLFAALTTTAPAVAKGKHKGPYRAFHIPVKKARPNRIITAGNGTMWFVETKVISKARVGRITPKGHLKQFTLSKRANNWGVDIAAGPGSSVWVLLNFEAVHLNKSGHVIKRVNLRSQTDSGMAIRVRKGTPWVLLDRNSNGRIGRIVHGHLKVSKHSPRCEYTQLGAKSAQLGISGGRAWCVHNYSGNTITRINPKGAGGRNYKIHGQGTGPTSMAHGPKGKVWFGHFFSHYIFAGTDGRVGFVRGNGKVKKFNVGTKVAPSHILRRPHSKQMWFASRGKAKAIGHINPKGHGAVHKTGKYKPVALTFDHRGRIWFTDARHNVIVRVSPKTLKKTNINTGGGVLRRH